MTIRLVHKATTLTFLFLLLVISALANEINTVTADTTGKKGIVIQNHRFSKQFTVLMRDTSLSGNRFDYWWHAGADWNSRSSSANYLLSAYLIDSILSSRCDSILLNNPSVKVTSWPKRDTKNLVKNFIRLYIGYVDNDSNLNVVVQFVKPKEFKRHRYIYTKELFLVVPTKELHFAIILFKLGEYKRN
jgi:hypothetical protein